MIKLICTNCVNSSSFELKEKNPHTGIYCKKCGNWIKWATKLEVKEDRLYRLNALINDYSLKSNQKLVGQTVKVLVDGMSSKENELCGYTETNKLVNFSGPLDLIGQIVNVRIDDAKSFSLDGVYVD